MIKSLEDYSSKQINRSRIALAVAIRIRRIRMKKLKVVLFAPFKALTLAMAYSFWTEIKTNQARLICSEFFHE